MLLVELVNKLVELSESPASVEFLLPWSQFNAGQAASALICFQIATPHWYKEII